MDYESILVHFDGDFYFWLTKDRKSGTLAPPEHMMNGEAMDILSGLSKFSYAVIEDGEVWRFGRVIGTIGDFEFI